jgi:TolB-like protein
MKSEILRKYTILLFAFYLNVPTNAQNFDSQLNTLAETISKQINTSKKSKVAVWGFVSENSESTSLGNYITEDFSIYVTNHSQNFDVIDRKHLEVILREHKLNAQGYIDETTAKEIGKILAVDAIITGTYTVLSNSLKIRAKVLDTETAMQFAASIVSVPLDENINSYLGLSNKSGLAANQGFNRPLNSKETINNPETVGEKCKENKFGNLCFYNATKDEIVVYIIYNGKHKHFFLDPTETKCYYEIPALIVDFYSAKRTDFEKELKGTPYKLTSNHASKLLLDKGEINIETCQSKSFTIK